jgi:hypothetical protein
MTRLWREILLLAALSAIILVILTTPGDDSARAQESDNFTPTPVSDLPPDLLAGLEQTEIKVRDLRGLSLEAELTRRAIEPDVLQTMIANNVMNNYIAAEAEADVAFYSAFGFMDRSTDLLTIVQSLATAQIIGFYDQRQDVMYVLSANNLSAFSSIFYARQYMYVLQAHQFHTADLLTPDSISASPDRAMAIMALIEGDAQMVTLRYIQELIVSSPEFTTDLMIQGSVSANAALDSAPGILKRELLFPSQAGLDFVRALYQATDDWRLVNEAYQRLPLSTEHILHPALYLLYEQPHEVVLRPLDDFLATLPEDEKWVLVRDQNLGEFYLREHLALKLEPAEVDKTASGWGGDRFVLYTHGSQWMMIWRLSWDTPADMQDFDVRYGHYLSLWLNIGGTVISDNLACWYNNLVNACKTTSDGDVLVAFAPAADLARQLLEYQLNTSLEVQNRIIG